MRAAAQDNIPRNPGPRGKTAFLIGAGRSGTTLLYKLLCMHREVAFISNYHERMPWMPSGIVAALCADRVRVGMSAWFKPAGNAYFTSRPWRKRLLPTPVEGEAVYRYCGIPLFPDADYVPDDETCGRLRARFSEIRKRMSARIMLSKRTANNRRITALATAFPDARFIHMIRDGREVTASLATVEWWDRHRLWWDGRTAAQLEESGVPRLAIAARNWAREMTAIQRGLDQVPKSRVMTVRYEEMLADPHAHIDRILRFLDLERRSDLSTAISELHLRCGVISQSEFWSSSQAGMVMDEIGPMLGRFGYI